MLLVDLNNLLQIHQTPCVVNRRHRSLLINRRSIICNLFNILILVQRRAHQVVKEVDHSHHNYHPIHIIYPPVIYIIRQPSGDPPNEVNHSRAQIKRNPYNQCNHRRRCTSQRRRKLLVIQRYLPREVKCFSKANQD